MIFLENHYTLFRIMLAEAAKARASPA